MYVNEHMENKQIGQKMAKNCCNLKFVHCTLSVFCNLGEERVITIKLVGGIGNGPNCISAEQFLFDSRNQS